MIKTKRSTAPAPPTASPKVFGSEVLRVPELGSPLDDANLRAGVVGPVLGLAVGSRDGGAVGGGGLSTVGCAVGLRVGLEKGLLGRATVSIHG